MSSDSVLTLAINDLQPNPFQPRGYFSNEEIDELVQSIKSYGILEPLVVAQTPAGYQIIAGERRWRAAKVAGLKEVPVIIKRTTPKGMLEMALVENVQRIDLSPIERAQAFSQLMRDFNFSATDLAEKIGKSKSYVGNTLRLLDLPDAIKDGLVGNQITEGHARAISGIPNQAAMVECYKVILRENASVRRAEDLARRYKEMLAGNSPDNDSFKAKAGRPRQISDVQLKQWRQAFQKLFKAKTDLRLVRSTHQTRIAITLKGSPEKTQADLDRIIALVEQNPTK